MSTKQYDSKDFKHGSDSNNLAEFPLALLGDTAAAGQTMLEFQDEIDDWESGERITRKVTITASDKWGLPTSKDEDVLLALIQLTKLHNGFRSPEVFFTKHEIIKLLGWKNRGWAYDRIEESLHRWKSLSIHHVNAWRDHAKRRWRDSEALGVIEYFRLTDGRQAGKPEREARSRFIWNSVLFASFQAGYLKKLDFEVYRNLQRASSRRAYRFLDKRFYHRSEWVFDLRHFATQKLGFSPNYDTGQLKAKLRPMFHELEAIGFIQPVAYSKLARNRWNVSITRHSTQVKLVQEATIPDAAGSLVQRLSQQGVAVRTSKSLVENFAVKLIEEKLDFFAWLVVNQDRRVASNPPGFLVAAIKNDYPMTKDYLQHLARTQKTLYKTKPSAETSTTAVAALQGECPSKETIAVELFLTQQEEARIAMWLAAALEETSRFTRESYERLKRQGGMLSVELRQTLLRDYVIRHRLCDTITLTA